MLRKKKMQNSRFTLRLLSLLLAAVMLFNMQGVAAYATAIGQVSENNAEENAEDTNAVGIEEMGNDTTADDSTENSDSLNANDITAADSIVAASGSPANPVHHCTKDDAAAEDGSDYTDWSYVYFGTYPQSEVTDAATIKAIDSVIAGEGKTSSGEGVDVWVGSAKYRRISKSDCNYDGYFDEVTNNGYRYFRWERIKWRVLNNNGATLFVIADKGIDCKCYHDTYTDVTWETSDIRSWLNGTFYQNAFSAGEQGAVVTQTVENADNPSWGAEGGNSTTDKVYLLSYDEVTKESYGFCSDYNTDSASRWRQPSAYARARGSYTYNGGTYTGGNDNGWWWLRSPGYGSDSASSVDIYGYVNRDGHNVTYDDAAVVPALHINLSSDLWSLTDDGTSGSGGKENGNSGTGNTGTDTGTKTNPDIGKKPQSVVKVTSLAITGISKKIAAGKSIQLTAEASPANATDKAVTWTSGNTKYATVSEGGKVSVKKAGAGKTVTITAKANDGSGVTAAYKITIMKDAVKSVKLSAANKTVKAGKSIKVKAAVNTSGKKVNKTLKWTSSNTDYATVNKNGKVTTKKAGKGKTVTITAQATDGSGKKAKIKIKIK